MGESQVYIMTYRGRGGLMEYLMACAMTACEIIPSYGPYILRLRR